MAWRDALCNSARFDRPPPKLRNTASVSLKRLIRGQKYCALSYGALDLMQAGSPGNRFQRKSPATRTETADGDDHNHHGGGDECEHRVDTADPQEECDGKPGQSG